ncbi:hypothetical protein [Bacillus cereus group sp. RP43]|uniref:hypothetical protein n=1 Tax=Bacillus cereus group sp. RP43 TaxID=3040260 RepID=UPI0033945645
MYIEHSYEDIRESLEQVLTIYDFCVLLNVLQGMLEGSFSLSIQELITVSEF